jgi:putative serine protease PepD
VGLPTTGSLNAFNSQEILTILSYDFQSSIYTVSEQAEKEINVRRIIKNDMSKVLVGVLIGAVAFGGVAKATGILGGNVVNGCVDNKTQALYAAVNGVCATGRTSVTLGSTITPGLGSSIKSVVSQVNPSVVTVNVKTAQGGDTGSGSVIKSDSTTSYVLTNNHVIAAAVGNAGTVTVDLSSGETVNATIVGETSDYDLAVLKIAKGNLPVIALGDSNAISVGDYVIAFGSPLALENTVTQGIVSALNRPVTTTQDSGAQSYVDAIQTDAAINPGNSGGPLTDINGRMIGVNSAIASLGSSNVFGGSSQSGSIGVGFSIPINEAIRIANEIIATGKATRPILGVTFDGTYTGKGAKIATTSTGDPANKAGIPSGAIITAIDGFKIVDSTSAIVKVRSYAPGATVTLSVTLPTGGTRNYTIALGSTTSN